MRQLTLRLVIALVTFGLGVAATTAWLAFHTLRFQEDNLFVVNERAMTVLANGANASMLDGCEHNRTVPFIGYKQPISGGVLNGKAISLPQPSYPQIGRAVHAQGTVIVAIIIDECGNVSSARAVAGHPLLEQAAVEAASNARFSPTLLSGTPVKVSGVIAYNFVLE